MADAADAADIVVPLAPTCPPAVVPDAVRSTGETSGPPADGDDDADGATGAPETGAATADGVGPAVTTGGRRSEPYAGNDPPGTAGPTAGGTGADIGALVTTVGATAAVPVSPAAITGAPEAVADVSTEGWIAADSIPAAAMVGAATGGGVGSGEAVCGAGVPPIPSHASSQPTTTAHPRQPVAPSSCRSRTIAQARQAKCLVLRPLVRMTRRVSRGLPVCRG